MNLLIVVVQDPEKTEDFFSVLVALDVVGLQVLNSSSVMDVLAREAPIFAGLRQLMMRPTAESKTIIGLVERNILRDLDRQLQKIDIDLGELGVGYAVLLPVTDQLGQAGLEKH